MVSDVRPRVTLTRTMPMSQWDLQMRTRQQPLQKEKTFDEKKKEIKDRVALKYLEQKYNEALHGKKQQPFGALSTNDSLVRD
jgi:hypothetical protein